MSLFKGKATRVDSWEVGSPETWHVLPMQPEPGWSEEMASALTQDVARRSALAEQLRGIQAELMEVEHLGIACWVPFPEDPWAMGVMAANLIVPAPDEPFTPERLQQALATPDSDGATVHQRSVDLVQLPAGSAVRHAELFSDDESGAIEERITFTVFPPQGLEAIELAFASPHLHLGEQFEEDTTLIAENLWIKLG